MTKNEDEKFRPKQNFVNSIPGRVQELANGKSLWIGTFQSVRVGWKIRLNVDMANKPAYEEGGRHFQGPMLCHV
jgi:hypothetical protein